MSCNNHIYTLYTASGKKIKYCGSTSTIMSCEYTSYPNYACSFIDDLVSQLGLDFSNSENVQFYIDLLASYTLDKISLVLTTFGLEPTDTDSVSFYLNYSISDFNTLLDVIYIFDLVSTDIFSVQECLIIYQSDFYTNLINDSLEYFRNCHIIYETSNIYTIRPNIQNFYNGIPYIQYLSDGNYIIDNASFYFFDYILGSKYIFKYIFEFNVLNGVVTENTYYANYGTFSSIRFSNTYAELVNTLPFCNEISIGGNDGIIVIDIENINTFKKFIFQNVQNY
jgi:hypothetical protein